MLLGNFCKSHPIEGFVRLVQMKQISLFTTGLELVLKRKREFMDEMCLVIPLSQLQAFIKLHGPLGILRGAYIFATMVMLCIHLLQQFF